MKLIDQHRMVEDYHADFFGILYNMLDRPAGIIRKCNVDIRGRYELAVPDPDDEVLEEMIEVVKGGHVLRNAGFIDWRNPKIKLLDDKSVIELVDNDIDDYLTRPLQINENYIGSQNGEDINDDIKRRMHFLVRNTTDPVIYFYVCQDDQWVHKDKMRKLFSVPNGVSVTYLAGIKSITI